MTQDTANQINTTPVTQPVLTHTQKIIKKWVETLRSGKYQQCYGVYQENDKYCAIGILGKITGDMTIGYKLSGNFFGKILERNDERKDDFNKIADYIESIADTIEIID